MSTAVGRLVTRPGLTRSVESKLVPGKNELAFFARRRLAMAPKTGDQKYENGKQFQPAKHHEKDEQ